MSLEPTEGVVDVGGLALHYERAGVVGGRPVVLLHGFTDNGRCWQRVADALAPSADVVMLDARNHGSSGSAIGTLADTAEDVVAVLDALGLDTVDLVGHSLGGCTAIEVAVRHSARVRRLVLEDPPWRHEAKAEDLTKRRGRLLGFFDTFAGLSVQEIIDLGRSQHPGWHARDFPAWAEAKQQVRLEAIETISTQPWAELVPQLQCPALLIHGDPALGGVVGQELAADVVALNDHCSAVAVAGAGHNVRREQFESYLSAIAAFLFGPDNE